MPTQDRLAQHWDGRLKARLGEWAHLLTLQEAQLIALQEENAALRQELAQRPAAEPKKPRRVRSVTPAVA